MTMYGNHGKILKVDLRTGEIAQKHYGEDLARMFLGGNGLAARLVHDLVPSDANPLLAENVLVFSVGPLTNTPVWGTSRGHVAAISPLTGLFADSNFGGHFPAAQKRTGFDAIAILGQSPGPVYLRVTDEGAELVDGAALWGKTTEETIAALEAGEGSGAACAAIGPAGENGVLFANIIGGGKRLGVAGRAGMGAVMGAKNLKAIVVKGSKRTEIADREGLKGFLKERSPILKEQIAPLSTCGTPVLVKIINSKGMLGTHNNAREVFEHFEDIGGELIKEKFWRKNTACFGCSVACGKSVAVPGGDYAGTLVKMPEYETLYALGSMLNEETARLVNLVTGWNIDLAGLETIGERIYNLERLINCQRGASRRDDTLPHRVMNEPVPDGPAKGRRCSQGDLDRMLDEYYALRGWGRDGIPTHEKLMELGLK